MKVCLKRSLIKVFIVLFLLFTSYLFSESSKEVIRVGIFDYAGYYSYDLNNKAYGYGFDYLSEIAKYADFEYEYVFSSWEGCLELLEKGLIDILDTSIPTPEWQENFLFSDYDTGENYGILTVKKDSNIYFNDIASFNNIKVGLVRNTISASDFIQFANENNISYSEFYFNTFSDMKEALLSGKVDAITSSSVRLLKDEKIVAYFVYRPYYFMINKNKPQLKKDIDLALHQIQTNTPDFNSLLFQKYFEDTNTVILSTEEQRYIKNTSPIKIVYDSFWEPFESYDMLTNTAKGLNVDLFNRIAGETGLPFEFVHGHSYDEAIEMVVSKEVDMLLSYDTNAEKATELGVTLSDTFLESPIGIIGLDYKVSKDAVFGISELHPLIYDFIRSRFPDNTVIQYSSIEDCYKALQDGDIDFTAENVYAAMQIIRSGDYGNLIIAYITNLKDRFSFMFRDDINENLVSILNKYIAALPVEEKEALLITYSSDTQTSGLESFFKRNAFGLLITITFLFFVVIISFVLIVVMQIRGNKKIWKQVYIDPVTQRANLHKLREDLAELLKTTRNRYYIYQCDISKFKLINELFGTDEGNVVLKAVNDSFYHALHDEKLGKCKGLVARKDRDTFVVVMKYDENSIMGNGMVREYVEAYKNFFKATCNHEIHYSIGRYLIAEDETDVQSILEKVNYAHGVARQSGTLDVTYDYDASLKQKALRQREIETRMHQALQESEFQVVLQPKYELKTETICGAEALVRWPNYKENKPLYPDEFIPLFEQNGFIVDLDFYMFTKVCILLSQWKAEGIPLVPISVNFSRLHIKNSSFVNELSAIADDYSVPRNLLEIELTETSLLEASDDILEKMAEKLREAGFTFVMDDFGSGYSSLGLLKDVDVDIIKLDKSFFAVNKSKERAHIVLENILIMVKDLGMQTVAEGVETKDDVDYLRELGCDIVQGYYFSRPLVLEEFMKLYTSNSNNKNV